VQTDVLQHKIKNEITTYEAFSEQMRKATPNQLSTKD
jgi:hypothetical protein